MEVSSKHQLFVFVIYILMGIGSGLFFDVQRSLRKMFFAGSIRTLFEDILFAVVCIFGAIVVGFLFNRGEMRYYQLMGLISGVLFYASFLSSFAMKILIAIYRFSRKFVIKPIVITVKIILFPFAGILRFLKKLYLKIKSQSKKAMKSIKSSKNKLKKRMKML